MKHFPITALAITAALIGVWETPTRGKEYPITFGGYLADEELSRYAPEATKLTAAPLVVVGRVESFNYVGEESLWGHLGDQVSGSDESRVDVFEASVSVDRVIAGDPGGEKIRVEACLVVGDSSNDTMQYLIAGPRFVFFLTREQESRAWKGTDPRVFALRDGAKPPPSEPSNLGIAEQLRLIAHANIRTADERCATRWFHLLASQYDPEQDREVCLEVMDDFRPHIRGQALALLCAHHPGTPGLYEKSMSYAEDWFRNDDWHRFRDRVSNLLYPVLAHHKPETIDDELRRWLRSHQRHVRMAALTSIRDERRIGLLSDVVDRVARVEKELQQTIYGESLQETPNRYWSQNLRFELYHCYKTLCKLQRKTLWSTDIFFEEPHKYLEEFRRYGTADKN